MTALISTRPVNAVARRSICANRSSRPSPRRPRIVSLRPAAATNRPNAAITTKPIRPLTSWPPSQPTSSTRQPNAKQNSGMCHFWTDWGWLLSLVIEHLLYCDAEIPGEGHGQRKRRGVPLVLDRVDRLPRYPHRIRQFPLGQVLAHPQRSHEVLHPAARSLIQFGLTRMAASFARCQARLS